MTSEAPLGGGNLLSALEGRVEDTGRPLLWSARPWRGPDGASRTAVSLLDLLGATRYYRQEYQALGVLPRDVVLLRSESSVELYVHWAALASLGAVAAPVSPRMAPDVVRAYADRIGAVGAVAEAGDGALLDRVTAGSPRWAAVAGGPLAPAAASWDGSAEPFVHDPGDPVALFHTSGTTGMLPKAAISTHASSVAGASWDAQQLRPPFLGQRVLNALPVHHASSFATISWALLSGTELVLAADMSAEACLDAVSRFEPDTITSFACTLSDVAVADDAELRCLRSVGLWLTTGDVAHQRDIQRVALLGSHLQSRGGTPTRVDGAFVIDCLGTSELGYMHFNLIHRPGVKTPLRCVGRPLGFVDAAVLAKDGTALPDGAIGMLGVRSPSVSPGYWNDSSTTWKSQLGGYWLTGDVGYRNAAGQYFQLDRRTDAISAADGHMYSTLVESAILDAFAEITRCAVVAPADGAGNRRVCVAALAPDAPERRASSWLALVNDSLRAAGLGELDEFLPADTDLLPLGPTGKVRKFLIREQLAAV